MRAGRAAFAAALLFPAVLGGAEETLSVPGGPAAIRRLVGLDPSGPASSFLVELHELLLFGVESEESWTRVEKRRAIVDFVADLAEWRREFGRTTVLATAPPETWQRSTRVLSWLGIDVTGSGGDLEATLRPDEQSVRRRAMVAALGAPARPLLSRLRAGERVSIEAADGSVPVPEGLTGWISGADPGGGFSELVRNVRASRLFVLLASLDRSTRDGLLRILGGGRGRATIDDLDPEVLEVLALYPDAIEITGGRFVLPGGAAADPLWKEVFSASPSEPARFLRALAKTDSGKGAYVVDALQQLPSASASAFVLGRAARKDAATRFRSLYRAIGGGTRFTAPRRDPYDFGHLVWFLRDGAEGGLELSDAAYDGDVFPRDEAELAAAVVEAARRRGETEEIFRRLFRQDVAGGTAGAAARRFLFVSSLVASRPALADPGVLVLLLRGLDRLYPAYAVFEDLPFDPPLARRYLFTLDRLDRRPPSRDTEIASGLFQAAVEIVAQLSRSGALSTGDVRRLFSEVLALPLFSRPEIPPADGEPALYSWLTARLLPALAPPGTRSEEESPDDELTRALVGRANPARFEWRGGRYLYDPAADEASRRKQFRERQRLASLADLGAIHRAREELAAAARGGDVPGTRSRVVGLVLALDLPGGEGEEEAAAVRASSPSEKAARRAAEELTKIEREALSGIERSLAPIDLLIAERHLEALLGHVYAASAGDPEDLYYQDPDFVRRHTFRTVEKGGKVFESAFRHTSIASATRGLAVSGSLFGLPDVLGLLHAEQLVYAPGARIALDPVRSGLIGPIRRMSPARADDDAMFFVAEACRAAEELAAAIAARGAAERLEAWRAVARDLVPRGRLAALAELTPEEAVPDEVAAHLSPSDLYRIGRRIVLGPAAGSSRSGAAAAARAAWDRLLAERGERGAGERLAEFGPRSVSFAGRFRLADIDMPPYERLARYRTPLLFGDRLYDLKISIARSLAAGGMPAALIPLLAPRALDEMMSRLRMGHAYDWRAIARAARSFSAADVDRLIDEAVAAGRIVRDQSDDPVEEGP